MSEDIFIAQSSPADAIVGPLHTVTYITSDKNSVEKAFLQGYGLDTTGWVTPSAEQRQSLDPYFGFSGSDHWETCGYLKYGSGANVQVRVIHVDANTPAIRPELNGFYTGGVTISFPINDMAKHEQSMADLGMPSTMGVKEMEFAGANGETYISGEIVYPAPENVYLLGVKRPDIFVPVGPVDPETDIGGAAYSARNAANSDAVVEFLDTVLGYEIRRDMEFEVGEESALLMPQGARERFVQAFAPGSQTGYLVLMDHYENNISSDTPHLGTPYRGISMWSFMSEDLDVVYQRSLRAGTEIIAPPGDIESPFMPGTKTLLLKDPSGFPIEICQIPAA